MELLKQKFFFKLCVMIRGNPYCYLQKDIEMNAGKTLTQNIEDPSPFLYVYRTPELAYSSEAFYTTKDFATNMPKTVVKIMCWGSSVETSKKVAFANMCVVENIGLPKAAEEGTNRKGCSSKISSRLKVGKLNSPRRDVPMKSKGFIDLKSPLRVYSSTISRRKSPRAAVVNKGKRVHTNAYELLRRMKEETEKLDKEIRDIENWNKLGDLEDMDTVTNSIEL